MKNQILISIYITNYNYGRYIDQAIKSVLKQTYKKIELIIIDDNSKDNSKKILKKYEGNKRILIINNKKNLGLIKSSKIAIKATRGRFFLRLDADDYLHPSALSNMIKIIKKKKDTALIFPNYYIFKNNSKKLKLMKYKNKTNYNINDTVAHGACSLINKKIYNKLGGYNIRFDRQDGYFLWLALLLNNYKIIHCNQPLFFYRKHSKSLSINILKLLKSRLKIINFFSKKNKKYKNLLLSNKRETIAKIKKLT